MRHVTVFCLLAILCAVPALGAELEVPGLDQVWEEAEGYGVAPGEPLDAGLSGLLADAAGQIDGLFRTGLSTAMKLIIVVLLCSLAHSVKAGEDGGLQAVTVAGALAITALTMTDMAVMIGLGRDTLGRMGDFSSVLLPAMAVLTAATGGVTAAAVRQGATVLFSQLLITAMDRLLVPLVYAYVAVSCAYAAVGNPGLKRVAGLLKGAITFFLTALLLAFVGYLTASGAIARMAISRAIPVVGGILADASESVLAGAGALRGAVGAAGMLAVLAICLTPFLRLALQYLVYKGASALCATVAQPQLSGLIDAIGSAFGLVLGMTGAGALVLLVGIVSAVKAVVP